MTGAEFGGVDIDLLADYIGGALAGTPDESAVAAQIAHDPQWRAAYASLRDGMASVEAELSRLAPQPMPAELAAALDTMMRTGEAPPRLTVIRGDGASAVRARKPGRRLRWATPIAVAAGAVAFAGFGADYLAGRDTPRKPGTTTAVQKPPGYAAAAPRILESGTDYTTDTLGTAPVQTLTAPSGVSSSPRKAPDQMVEGGGPTLGRLSAQPALRDCLDAIARDNASGGYSVESVDYARFNGSPALVVRFSAANGSFAWAVGPSCGSGGSDVREKVSVR